MGFFTDAYDLFCISLVTKLLGRIYYRVDGSAVPGTLPPHVSAAVNSVAFVGWARSQGSSSSAGWATSSAYANKRTRGAFIAAVFAMQGFGIMAGGLVAIVVSAAFKARFPAPAYDADPAGSTPPQADLVWRIIVLMLGAMPAALTYYCRTRMPETARYTALFLRRHGVHLLGTSATWFLLDIAFYSHAEPVPEGHVQRGGVDPQGGEDERAGGALEHRASAFADRAVRHGAGLC
ncbi:inorganic phosphate transporter 3 [Panicum miliaceum]|uniref:Inorganic phosphate transporter 3 n=1 Tax=Panicum miliaceum TaxID=4540 RepID=A0A3L6PPQ5_PANMI|nr:inorganic phosphate transporter 3 [Panicum miliaceum]